MILITSQSAHSVGMAGPKIALRFPGQSVCLFVCLFVCACALTTCAILRHTLLYMQLLCIAAFGG